MRVLVVNSFEQVNAAPHPLVMATLKALEANGNTTDLVDLRAPAFDVFMSSREWQAYETSNPLLAEETIDSAALIQQVDAMLFLYETTLFGLCPRVKAWMERVLVPTVAFTFDSKNRLQPAMTNIVRLGAVTTTPHSKAQTAVAGGLGRRVILRAIRLNCSRRCRRTFVRIYPDTSDATAAKAVERALQSWS